MTKAGWIGAAAAALMLGASMAMPPMGQQRTPVPVSVAYDGDGKKVRAKAHPRHNAKRRTPEWQRYAEAVMSTHRVLSDGRTQTDPRDDKYLHSHARMWRGFVKAIDRRGTARAAA